ncbi:Barrier-to-autointegration factor B [Liparis tanakae]|uniref:Barrier-to-autointegration factor-like protein n=1 Tax=Liparis tanakae TaxID=230148 RepID=A0A4Z2ESX7_9TELE|nr:Barrier-to-autointegration factor B [Liparis tanakae]
MAGFLLFHRPSSQRGPSCSSRCFPGLSMSSTTQKHRDFVGEPMGDKSVTALSGIGATLGEKLRQQGFDKAYVVLGQFLLLKKDPEMFSEWLKDASGANGRQAAVCTQCLREWSDAFL